MAAEVRVSRRELQGDFEAVFARLADAGDLVWVAAGKQRFLLVNEVELVAEVLVERRAELVKPRLQAIDTGPLRPERVDPRVPVSVFRRGVTSGLAGREDAGAAAAARAAADEAAAWRDGDELEVMPTLRRIAIRTATEGAFASSLEPTDVERLDQVIRWFDGAPRVVPASRFSRYSLRRRQMELQLGEVARSLLANADRAAGGELSVLDELDLDDRGRLAFVGELLLGAVGPLAQTAGWLFHRFTIEPEESDRLRAEWPATGRTDAFLSEVTRLHPTNPRITRAAIADTIVGGEHVPAHTRVVLNVNAINRDPRVYESPERLLLERWLGGRPPKWGYLSFGLGDRRCLGDVFARASLTALLPALAGGRRFELHDVAETTTGRRQLAEMTRATVSVC